VHDILELPGPTAGRDAPVASQQRLKDSVAPGAAAVAPNYVDSQASLNEAGARVASAESKASISRPVTFADVRDWVAAGGDSAEIEAVTSPAPVLRETPATAARRQAPAHSSTPAPALDAASLADNYTLEIGSIHIVMDEPRVPAQQTAAIPARAERPAQDHSWTLRSRHYLR